MFSIQRQGTVDVLSGDLPLNADHVARVAELCGACLAARQPRLVCDLRRVPLIDSAGLELLLDLRDRCVQGGGTLLLSGAGPLCRDILAVSGVSEQISMFDDLTEALGSYLQ